MSFTTFSGPVRAGTTRYGTVATGRNTGLAVLAQSYDTGDLTGAIVGNVDTLIMNIPKGSQIVDIVIDQVVASATGTTTVSVGNATGGAQLAAAVATTAGGRFRGVATAATQLAWQLSTTADTTVYIRNATGTATLTAGRFIVTVEYIQRKDDGSQNPTSTTT
jgi:hypothetical protein